MQDLEQPGYVSPALNSGRARIPVVSDRYDDRRRTSGVVFVTERRQISDSEKQQVLERQGKRCFIDNHPIDSEAEVEFDHIQPYSEQGPSHVDNIAVVCKRHNRDKRQLSLSQYRDKLAMRRFFEGARKRRLDDLLEERLGAGSFGNPLTSEQVDGSIKLYIESGPREFPLQACPSTGEEYFFAVVPVAHVRNDAELQPRALETARLWELYLHLQAHTQLAPAICRLVGDQLLLFDGQHKAAAQVWAGRRSIDCKVYIDPEVRRLKETNLSAHDKLRQMPFYTSTLLEKYAALASEDWEEFLQTSGPKTEIAFVDFMRTRGLTRAKAIERIASLIYRDVLDHPDNRLRDYIAEENRGRKNPLTMSRMKKTFFKEFVARPPLADEFESETYFRDAERENIVRLFNRVVDLGLDGKWAPERDDEAHKKAARLFSAGALRAWVPMLRDAMAPALSLFDQEDRRQLLYRNLSDEHLAAIDQLVVRLFGHQVWEDPSPELNDLRYDNAERAKDMLMRAGLTTNWLLGGDA